MTFEEALKTLPQWVQWWMLWLGVAIVVSVIVLAFSKATRRDALIILLTNVAVFVVMQWMYQTMGFVRLLGLAHVIFWTPLAIYLWRRLKQPTVKAPFRQVIWVLPASISAALVFDYIDVARYLMGERGIMGVS